MPVRRLFRWERRYGNGRATRGMLLFATQMLDPLATEQQQGVTHDQSKQDLLQDV